MAHLYTLDHLVQSLFHYLFYLDYWYNVPHDGRRTANSQAQQDLINLAASRGEIIDPATQETPGMDELRKALAGDIWRTEKVYAGWTLVFGFFLKASASDGDFPKRRLIPLQVYFILTLYSYAAHLRSSTYHTLPLTSRSTATQIAHPDPPQPTRGPGDATAGPSSRQSNPRQDAVGKEMERLRQEEEGFSWE